MKGVLDMPSRLLAFAARRMPPARSEWGAAMLAELTEVRDSRERWEFALGWHMGGVFSAWNRRTFADHEKHGHHGDAR